MHLTPLLLYGFVALAPGTIGGSCTSALYAMPGMLSFLQNTGVVVIAKQDCSFMDNEKKPEVCDASKV